MTAAATTYPVPCECITICTSVRIQAAFHIATIPIYNSIISKPVPSAASLLSMDDNLIGNWLSTIPSYFSSRDLIPRKFMFTYYVYEAKYRNLRIIIYRPFVIRRALASRSGTGSESADVQRAFDRCLDEAQKTIVTTEAYWRDCEHTRMAAWYAL
jgi:transcriptional regulatory protein GAL4